MDDTWKIALGAIAFYGLPIWLAIINNAYNHYPRIVIIVGVILALTFIYNILKECMEE